MIKLKNISYSEKIQSNIPGENIRGILCSFLFIFGLFLGFSVGWVTGGIVIIISIVFAMPSHLKEEELKITNFDDQCNKHNVIYKPDLSDAKRHFFIGVSEEKGTLLIEIRISDHEIERFFIDANEILNVELSIDDNAIYKAGPVASISAAALGGLAFGGAGAIVGSLTTASIGKGKLRNLCLKMRINNIDSPLMQIPFLTKAIKSSSPNATQILMIADKWANLVEVIRYKNAKLENR